MSILFLKKTVFLDILIIVVMSAVLYCSAAWQKSIWYTDVGKYQCYAVSFWKGTPALKSSPILQYQCDFVVHPDPSASFSSNSKLIGAMEGKHVSHIFIAWVESQSPSQPLHALPLEYPLLTIIPFSLGLIAPASWYQSVFSLWMAAFAGVLYMLLRAYRSRGAAIAFALYLMSGCWGTALTRFDLVPAGLTLVVLLCAERRKWNWAFALLALATMLKFYPVLLLPPLLLAQQRQRQGAWYAYARWQGLAVFVLMCAATTIFSLLLSLQGTLSPLTYFDNRPIQVESTASSFLWLVSLRGYPLRYVVTYGSLNVISPFSSIASAASTFLLGAGVLYTWWLQWRGRIALAVSILLTLLIVIVTGKVFSPQYLIWIIPFVAYVGESNWKWLASWISIGLLTTDIFPYIYSTSPDLLQVPLLPAFHPTVFVRNSLLLVFVIVLLYHYSRKRMQMHITEDAVELPEQQKDAGVAGSRRVALLDGD